MLPWTMLDGVNEKGVGAGINVCPVEDLKFYMPDEGTNPGKEEVESLRRSAMCWTRQNRPSMGWNFCKIPI